MKKKIDIIIKDINDLPLEIKTLEFFIKKVDLLDDIVVILLTSNPQNIDTYINEILENILNHVVGITYSLEFIRGELTRLDSFEFDATRAKLNKIGHLILSLSKLYLPVVGNKYLNALHASKALVNYEKGLIDSLDFEIRMVAYKLNNKSDLSV